MAKSIPRCALIEAVLVSSTSSVPEIDLVLEGSNLAFSAAFWVPGCPGCRSSSVVSDPHPKHSPQSFSSVQLLSNVTKLNQTFTGPRLRASSVYAHRLEP